jgi:hypothetical protein
MEVTWYHELIVLFVGIILVVIGFNQKNKISKILNVGISVEGVVMRTERDPSPRSSMYYPVVRFVTADKEWITKQYDVGGQLNAYKEGDKLTVVYDPKDPENFIIDNTRSKILGPLFIAIGVVAVLLALLMALLLLYPQIKIPYFHT